MLRLCLVLLAILCGCEAGAPTIESTTVLSNTDDEDGPYEVTTVVIGATSAHRVELFYSIDSADPDRFIPLLMRDAVDDNSAYDGEVFVSEIPGQRMGSEVRYFISVSRDRVEIASDPVGGALAPFSFSIAP